jgi:hypothetical protein
MRSLDVTGSWVARARILRVGAVLAFAIFGVGGIVVAASGADLGESSPASEPGRGTDPSSGAPPPDVDLDQLLRLPNSYDAGGGGRNGRYGNSSPTDWRNRFADSNSAVDRARKDLADMQEELGTTAADSSQWQMGAPGLGKPDAEHATVSYKLRVQIRDLRKELQEAEKRHKELVIEADLAGVPAAWRRPHGEEPPEEAPREG